MGLLFGIKRSLFGGRKATASYLDKALSYGPIAYWVQGEAAGLTAADQVNSPLQDGTYTGVTLGQAGIGDGNTCPLYDGINDLTNIHSATLAGAFDGALGTFCTWVKVSGAGVWTDSAFRAVANIGVDSNNRVNIVKSNVANTLLYIYYAAGTIEQIPLAPVSETGWMFIASSWSGPGGDNRFRGYYADSSTPCYLIATSVTLGIWVGALANGECSLGARSAGVSHWSGYEAHAMLFDRELTLTDLTDLSVV